MERLEFAVDKFDLVEMADSEIMKIKMYIVSEGDNHHKRPISWDSIQAARATLVGKPIVAKYNKFTQDVMGHEFDEVPIGVILRDEDIFEETDEDGKRWLGAMGDIWMRYSQDISGVLIRDMFKDLSMEIIVAEESENGDIDAFAFTGITLINKNPAIPNARAEVLSFQEVKDEIEKRVFSVEDENDSQLLSTIDEKVDLIVDKLYKKFQEKEGEQMKEEEKFELSHNDIHESIYAKLNPINDEGERIYKYWIREVFDSYFIVQEEEQVDSFYKINYKIESDEVTLDMENMAKVEMVWVENSEEIKMACDKMGCDEKMEEVYAEEVKMGADANVEAVAQEKSEEILAEEQTAVAKEENKPEMMEIEVSKYESMMTEMEEMKLKMKAMDEDKDVYMSELGELKQFKQDYDDAKFSAEIESTLIEVSDTLPKEIADEFRTTAATFSIENISEWKNQVYAKAYTFTKGNETKSKHMSIDIPNQDQEKKKKSGLWN